MNKKLEEGFKQFDKAVELIGKGIEDFFNEPSANVKAVDVNSSDTIVIKISTLKDRFKAAWRLITRGEVRLRNKK